MLKPRKRESKNTLADRKKRQRSVPVSPIDCVEMNDEKLELKLNYPLT